MKISANLDTDEYYIQEPDDSDNWDIGKKGITLNKVSVSPTTYGDDLPVKLGDTVYVLIEHYGDGCTFGSSECMEVKGIFTEYIEARAFEKTIHASHGYFGWHIQFLVEEAIVQNV